jgi:hypothetical protein
MIAKIKTPASKNRSSFKSPMKAYPRIRSTSKILKDSLKAMLCLELSLITLSPATEMNLAI